MKKFLLSVVLSFSVLLSYTQAMAMTTYEFDEGMKKGIEYYNEGMYYEAKDEFQWFCDYNWGNMNAGQQKYALDYLGEAKARASAFDIRTYYYSGTNLPDFSKVTEKKLFGDVSFHDNMCEYKYKYWIFDELTNDIKLYEEAMYNSGWMLDSYEENDTTFVAYYYNKHSHNIFALLISNRGGYTLSVLIPSY